MNVFISKVKLIFLLSIVSFTPKVQSQVRVEYADCYIEIIESSTKRSLPFAACVLSSSEKTRENHLYSSSSDDKGTCIFQHIPVGEYVLQVFYMGQTYLIECFF